MQTPSTGSQVVPLLHVTPRHAVPARHERALFAQVPPSLPAGQAQASPLWQTTPLHLQKPSAVSHTFEPVHATPLQTFATHMREPSELVIEQLSVALQAPEPQRQRPVL